MATTRRDRQRMAQCIDDERLEARKAELGPVAWAAEQFEAKAKVLRMYRERRWTQMTIAQIQDNMRRERAFLQHAVNILESGRTDPGPPWKSERRRR